MAFYNCIVNWISHVQAGEQFPNLNTIGKPSNTSFKLVYSLDQLKLSFCVSFHIIQPPLGTEFPSPFFSR